MELRRVVVTGLGALTPLGNDVKSTWENLTLGKSGAAPITRFDASEFRTQFACEVRGFDATSFIDRKEARKMDRFSHFALWVSEEAVRDAGLDLDNEDLTRIGVIWGSGVGGIDVLEENLCGYTGGAPRFNPYFIPRFINNMAAGWVSMRFGVKGINYATSSACASSTHALIDALNYIRMGKADVFIAGGSETPVNLPGIGGFNALHAISTRNDSPETASRPFSKSRDGFVVGEGAACLILEEYNHAIARGAKIYAEFIGGGMSADAFHMTAPDPEGDGAAAAMRNALADAGVTPDQVDYINAHGTSTPLGDIAEAKAIEQVFGEHTRKMNVSSTKSMTGHLLGAAGAVEAMVSVLAIQNNIVPPTINHADDDCDENINYETLNFTFNQAQKRIVNYALSNTFGFGGHNACVLFKKML